MWVLVLGLGFYSALLLLLSPLLPVLFARFPAVLLRRPRGLLLLLLWSAPSVGYLALVLRHRPRSPSARRYVDGSGRRSASPLHQPLLASRTARGCSLITVGCFLGLGLLSRLPAWLAFFPAGSLLSALFRPPSLRARCCCCGRPHQLVYSAFVLCHRPRSPSRGATLMVPVADPPRLS
jgi:hypothetical protein